MTTVDTLPEELETDDQPDPAKGPKPLEDGKKSVPVMIALWTFVVVPFVSLVVGTPLAWSAGYLTWTDVVLGACFYVISGLGVTIGYHRYLTHGAFKAKRWLRVVLTVAASMALQGQPTQWVADHRRHHTFSDVEGDPHSPWRFGATFWALAKGLGYAHLGWLFHRELTNKARFASDLLADRDIQRVDKLFIPIALSSVLAPGAIVGLISWSWQGVLWGIFWGGLVRVSLLHHVTWSINSICHVVGTQPFKTRKGDKAANFWPLAILSFGESWHNLHHADPTCARHGVDRGQVDISARTIWLFEKFGWIHDVRWPKADRLAAKRVTTPTAA